MRIFIIGHISPDLDSVATSVAYAELLKKIKRYKESEVIPVIPSELNQETKFVFHHFNINPPLQISRYKIKKTDKFVLLDHNEVHQRHPDVEVGEVVEIIDHHKINMNLDSPVRIDMKPYGAISTIVYELYEMYGIKPSKKTSALILSSILSDTQGLKSSTCTDFDKMVVNKLSINLKIDIEKWNNEIAEQKSDLSNLSHKEIVFRDIKEYFFSKKKIFISQIETTRPDEVFEMKESLLRELKKAKNSRKADFAYLLITDITNIKSLILYTTDEERLLVEKAFDVKTEYNYTDIKNRTSRKKDISIHIEETLEKGL